MISRVAICKLVNVERTARFDFTLKPSTFSVFVFDDEFLGPFFPFCFIVIVIHVLSNKEFKGILADAMRKHVEVPSLLTFSSTRSLQRERNLISLTFLRFVLRFC